MCGTENATVDLGGFGRVREIVHTIAIPRDDGSGEDHVRFVDGDGGELLAIAHGMMRECLGYETAVEQLRSAIPPSIRNGYERFDVVIRDVDPYAPMVPGTEPKVRKAVGLTELGFIDLLRKHSESEAGRVMRTYRAVRDDDFVRERWSVVRDHELDDDFESMFPGVDEFPDQTETSVFNECRRHGLRVIRKTRRSERDFGTVLLLNLVVPGNENFWGIPWSSLQSYFNYKGRPVLNHWENGKDYVIVRIDGSVDFVLRGSCLVYNIKNRRGTSRGRALMVRLSQGDERWGELLGIGRKDVEAEDRPKRRASSNAVSGDSPVKSYTYVPEDGKPYAVNVVFLENVGPVVSLADMRKALVYDSHVPLNRMNSDDYVNSPTPVPGLSGAKRFLTRSGYEKAYARRVKSDRAKSKVLHFDEWFWETVAPDIEWEVPDRWRNDESVASGGESPTPPDETVSQVPVESPVEVPIGTGVLDEDSSVLTDETLARAEAEKSAGAESPVPATTVVTVASEATPVPTEVPEPSSSSNPENLMTVVYGGDRGCVRVRFGCTQGVVFAVEDDFLGVVDNSDFAREALGKLSDYEFGEKNIEGSPSKVVAEFGMYRVLETVRVCLRSLDRDTSTVDSASRWLATVAIPRVHECMSTVPPISSDVQQFADGVRDQVVEYGLRMGAEVDKLGRKLRESRNREVDEHRKNTDLVNQINDVRHRADELERLLDERNRRTEELERQMDDLRRRLADARGES